MLWPHRQLIYYGANREYVEFCQNGTDPKCFSKKVINKKCSEKNIVYYKVKKGKKYKSCGFS